MSVIPLDPLASNGISSSDNFDRWFGNSKVVDGKGQPLVLYHSTFSEFDSFQKTKDLGFHFGSAAVANKRFEKAVLERPRGEKNFDGLNILPVHLRIERPLHLSSDPCAWASGYVIKLLEDALAPGVIATLRALEESALANARLKGNAVRAAGGPGLIRRRHRWTSEITIELSNKTWITLLNESNVGLFSEIRRCIQQAGFDGLTYMNTAEGEGRTTKRREANPMNMTWVALDSKQIKSATGNVGLYMPDSGSLTDTQDDLALRQVAKAHLTISCMQHKPPLRAHRP